MKLNKKEFIELTKILKSNDYLSFELKEKIWEWVYDNYDE